MSQKHLHHLFTILSYVSLLSSILSAIANALSTHAATTARPAVNATATEVKP